METKDNLSGSLKDSYGGSMMDREKFGRKLYNAGETVQGWKDRMIGMVGKAIDAISDKRTTVVYGTTGRRRETESAAKDAPRHDPEATTADEKIPYTKYDPDYEPEDEFAQEIKKKQKAESGFKAKVKDL